MEALEDGQRLLPGIAGRLMVSAGVLAIAELGEGIGLVVAVAELGVQGQGSLMAADGVWVAAKVVQGISDAGPGGGLTVVVAEFAV